MFKILQKEEIRKQIKTWPVVLANTFISICLALLLVSLQYTYCFLKLFISSCMLLFWISNLFLSLVKSSINFLASANSCSYIDLIALVSLPHFVFKCSNSDANFLFWASKNLTFLYNLQIFRLSLAYPSFLVLC